MAQEFATREAWLGLDLGTSSVKAVLTDIEGRILARAREGLDLHAALCQARHQFWL